MIPIYITLTNGSECSEADTGGVHGQVATRMGYDTGRFIRDLSIWINRNHGEVNLRHRHYLHRFGYEAIPDLTI